MMDTEEKDKGGRPELTEEEKNEIVQKLEPYLKAGLSLRKACLEAQVPKSTVYEHIKKDAKFADKIERNRHYLSILVSNTTVRQLLDIVDKQQKLQDKKAKGEKIGTIDRLNKIELEFLKWFATNSNITREEFSERKDIGLVDPEVEIQKMAQLASELAGEKNE